MALSNIFREPRREITESAVGIGIVAVLAWADYQFAQWVCAADDSPRVLGMMLGAAIFMIACGILIITHALGDAVCNSLETRGIHLRPRNRPGR
jgi:hypothetical protein